MRLLGGHLSGSTVTALVDGQLDRDSGERAWSHVAVCPACRRAVEREGWVKRQLAEMTEGEPSERLLGSLYRLDHSPEPQRPSWQSLEAWAAVGEIEHRSRNRRRAGLALVGVGSVSAAVIGFATLGGSVLGIGGAPAGPPEANLTQPHGNHTHAVIAPRATVHGRLPGPVRGASGPDRDHGRERPVVLLSRR
jgi:hypothetical protein